VSKEFLQNYCKKLQDHIEYIVTIEAEGRVDYNWKKPGAGTLRQQAARHYLSTKGTI